jgi:hypothetical protein
MDSQPIRNHPFIPPLLIGLFSLFGLCTILALAFLPEQNAEIVPTRTFTPFKYQFLATETLTSAATLETTETAEPFQTSETDVLRIVPTEAFTVATITLTNTSNQSIGLTQCYSAILHSHADDDTAPSIWQFPTAAHRKI